MRGWETDKQKGTTGAARDLPDTGSGGGAPFHGSSFRATPRIGGALGSASCKSTSDLLWRSPCQTLDEASTSKGGWSVTELVSQLMCFVWAGDLTCKSDRLTRGKPWPEARAVETEGDGQVLSGGAGLVLIVPE